MKNRLNKWHWLAVAVVVLLIADQGTKLWAIQALASGPIVVSPSWFRFEYVENPGAAWNILSGAKASFRHPFFVVVGLAMMTFITLAYARTADRLNQVGLALVLGGALGNFADRVRLHHVVDFVTWHVGEAYYWPTFNVADAAICVGVGLLLLGSFKRQPAPT